MCVDNAYGPMPGWDVSDVTDMSNAFSGQSTFNADVGRWDTSSVTSMSRVFYGCSAFDQFLAGWNTSSVTDMSGMFEAGAYTRPLLSST